jgi:pimeloyl-ACP methyl ester carboxylesterase
VPWLSRHRELLLVDLPGHGESALPHGHRRWGVTELTDEIEHFLTEVAASRPVVVGNSLGGAIALELARRGLARAVVALAPIGFWSRSEIRYVVMMLRISQTLARLLAPVTRSLLRRPRVRALALGTYFAHPLRLDPEEAVRTVRRFATAPGVSAILPYSRHYRLRPDEGIDTATTTVAWGTQDRLLVTAQADRARALLPHARHVRLPNAGHVPMLDTPRAVADLILSASR